jgi:hypothetical protein
MAMVVCTAGCLARLTPSTAAPAPARSIAPAPAAAPKPFAWAGVYDIVGDGFPDGMRSAIITITPRDTVFDFFIEGPPGTLMSSTFDRDSLHVVWDMYGEPMYVELRGIADSLDGRWKMADRGGNIWGTRRK